MYYNIRNQEIINNVPLNGYFSDGILVQGLNLANIETQKLCGIYPIKSDTPFQPENTIEDLNQRVVIIEDDGVIIERTWITKPIEPSSVPQVISPRQIRLWLIQNDISLSTVENAINNIENNTLREITKIEWQYSPYIERHHPMIDILGSALGLDSETIDQAFITASNL